MAHLRNLLVINQVIDINRENEEFSEKEMDTFMDEFLELVDKYGYQCAGSWSRMSEEEYCNDED